MTQVSPQPVQPATEIQLSDIEDFSHITLHQAARDGNIDVIKKRLSKENKVKLLNKRDKDNTAPLHYAVRYGKVEVVNVLVDLGADINIPGEDEASPLHYAARFRASDSRQVSQVIPGGENGTVTEVPLEDASLIHLFANKCKGGVNVKDSYESTPLHYAVSKSSVTAVKELLMCPGIDVNAKDVSGSTPLHCAAIKGNVEIFKVLLEARSNPRAKDEEEPTPTQFACMNRNAKASQLLFGQVEKDGVVREMLEDKNKEGETVLHSAVKGGEINIVEECLKKGAKVTERRNNGATPLHIAAINGDVKIAELLVVHKAEIEARNTIYETPLHKAAAFNKTAMVEFLLDKKAVTDCRDEDEYTPLLVAASGSHTAVVSSLINRGADLQVKNSHDKTAIFLAAEGKRVDRVHTLKAILENEKAKSLINESDRYENTPLHVAAQNGYASVVQVLLVNGAERKARNQHQDTPLHLAAKHGKTRAVLELLEGDLTIINDEDEGLNTPLHLAAIGGHLECCKVLLKKGAVVDARNSKAWTPLDCAAHRGHLKVANILLTFDSPVDPIDKAKTTPLHLAAKKGHADMVKLLLSKGADITLTDHKGRNCLDLAADHSRKEAAMAIVNDENWKSALQKKLWEKNSVTTPLRKLIIKLPSVAEAVFNRCVKVSKDSVEDKYKVTFSYVFLEDIYVDWPVYGDDGGSETTSAASSEMEGIAGVEEFRNIRGPAEAVPQLEKKESHPLIIMVKNEREQLLGHPLVAFLLDYKWRKFGRYIYYFKLALYCLFLLFLTGYAVYSTEHAPVCANETVVDKGTVDESSVSHIVWISVGRFVILVLASIHILSELFQIVYQRRQYCSWGNLLEWSAYGLAIVFVADEFDVEAVSSCSTAKKTIGALSIFLAWMGLVLFIRKFPKLGIYVVMLTSILYTFAKFFMIYVLFLFAFALSFFTLFHDPKQSVRAFGEPGRAIVKTAVMMIGEFDFDDLLNSPDSNVPDGSWFIFIIFLIIMTLILMNLLIGLAVDDIKGVQELAVLERQAMLVDLVMDVEKALPSRHRQRYVPETQDVLPNQYEGLKGYWYSPPMSAREVHVALKPIKSPHEVLSDRTDELQETVNTIQRKQEEIHKMLVDIVKKREVVEADDDEDD